MFVMLNMNDDDFPLPKDKNLKFKFHKIYFSVLKSTKFFKKIESSTELIDRILTNKKEINLDIDAES